MKEICEAGLRLSNNVKRDSNIGSAAPCESGFMEVSNAERSYIDCLMEIVDQCNKEWEDYPFKVRLCKDRIHFGVMYDYLELQNKYFVIEIPTDKDYAYNLFRVYTKRGMCMTYSDMERVSYIQEKLDALCESYSVMED